MLRHKKGPSRFNQQGQHAVGGQGNYPIYECHGSDFLSTQSPRGYSATGGYPELREKNHVKTTRTQLPFKFYVRNPYLSFFYCILLPTFLANS